MRTELISSPEFLDTFSKRLSKVTDQISKKMAKDHPEIKPGYKAPSAPQAGR